MKTAALRSIADALDAAHASNGDAAAAQALYKAASKNEKETWAPLKALMSQKYDVPTSTQLLQTCVEHGGDLGALAAALLHETPRELWRSDGDPVALKRNGTAAVFRGAVAGEAVVRAALPGKKPAAYDLYDLPQLALAHPVVVSAGKTASTHAPLAVRFVDADTLRVILGDGQLVEQKVGEKKGRVIASVADRAVLAADAVEGCAVGFCGGAIDNGGDHFAVVVERGDANGDNAYTVIVDGGAGIALDGVASVNGVFFVEGAVYVCVVHNDGRGGLATVRDGGASIVWLPRQPSGGTAPDRAEYGHEVVSVFGATWLITWSERAPTAQRWLRLPDLVEDARFGADFCSVSTTGDAVWSAQGDRVTRDGPRTSPIAYPGRCFCLMAIDEACVVALICDSNDKLSLRRFRRL